MSWKSKICGCRGTVSSCLSSSQVSILHDTPTEYEHCNLCHLKVYHLSVLCTFFGSRCLQASPLAIVFGDEGRDHNHDHHLPLPHKNENQPLRKLRNHNIICDSKIFAIEPIPPTKVPPGHASSSFLIKWYLSLSCERKFHRV